MTTFSEKLPLDFPVADRPHRVYAALTNACNRACPWCSTCSSPAGSTFLSLDDFLSHLPETGNFEVQLEGGEPTIHPYFDRFVAACRANPRCVKLVFCTNGVVLPRQPETLAIWARKLGSPLTIKLSINHYLLDHDPNLIELARMLDTVCRNLEAELILNVRLRKGFDDSKVVGVVREACLAHRANVFYLQRYGFASGETAWDTPFLVGYNFRFINPDGTRLGTDLVERSEAMRILP